MLDAVSDLGCPLWPPPHRNFIWGKLRRESRILVYRAPDLASNVDLASSDQKPEESPQEIKTRS